MTAEFVAVPMYLRGKRRPSPAILDRGHAEAFQVYGPHAVNRLSSTSGYPTLGGKMLHRLILGLDVHDPGVVHHLNENRANCTLANLWVCADSSEHGTIWHSPSYYNLAAYRKARAYQERVGFRQPPTSAYFDLETVPELLLAKAYRKKKRVVLALSEQIVKLERLLEGVAA